MALPDLHCLGWADPLVLLVADWLLARRDTLPQTLVVVPTAHSGRRLRVELARRAGGGVMAPRLATPDGIFRAGAAAGDLAPATQAMLRAAWAQALVAATPDELDPLVPRAEEMERDFAWAMQVAEGILPAMDLLGEAGMAPIDVPARCAAAEQDAGRWEVLDHLARKVENRLRRAGRVSPEQAKCAVAAAPVLPPGVRHLVIAAVPDPVPLAKRAWENLLDCGHCSVDVLVHAPAEARAWFDVWGRPDKDAWATCALPLPGGESAIQIAVDDRDAAARAVAACLGKDSPSIALGVPDASLVPALEREFEAHGWQVFDPEGRPAGTTGLGVFLDAWLEVARDQPVRFAPVSRWLRVPAAWEFLRAGATAVVPYRLTKALDELQAEFLPETLDDAIRGATQWAQVSESRKNHEWLKPMGCAMLEAFSAVAAWRAKCTPGNLAATLSAMCDVLATAGHDDGAEGKLLDALADAMDDLKDLEAAFPELDPADLLACWRRGIREVRTSTGHEDAVLDLLGWLELPYESGPHLVLAGMHDGIVPDARRDDALLPDSVRGALGLRDRATRAARDAFLFRGMLECRAGGSVTVIAAKFDGHGEPCKPSSLLLRCPSAQLPARVAHCFAEPQAGARVRPAAQRGGWYLDFPRLPEREAAVAASMSPTKIRDYLRCPFRFYLRHVLGMDRFEPDAREMDSRHFGTLIHQALEDFGRAGEDIRWSDNPATIRDFLLKRLDHAVAQRFGSSLSLPLLVQVSSARERLVAMAARQAESRADGWLLRHAEYPVGRRGGPDWLLAGCPMSMTIDRIDFHPGRRCWRVLDYKTGSSGKGPEAEHLEIQREGTPELGALLPPSSRGVKPRRWCNVQLPLYAACCRRVLLPQLDGARPDDAIECGYVVLPPAVSEVKFSLWDDYNETLEASAIEWSEEAIRRIRDGIFGPPVEMASAAARHDDFQEMAPDGWAAALAPAALDRFP